MMRRVLVLVVLAEVLALSSTALASPGDTIWIRRYDAPGLGGDIAREHFRHGRKRRRVSA